jgi:hypothetical protein
MILSLALSGALTSAALAAATPTPGPKIDTNIIRINPGIVLGTPKPSVSTLTLVGQSPITLPNVQMNGSDSGAGSNGAGAHASSVAITFTLNVPAQSTQAGQLELWCDTNKAFTSAQLWMPAVSTLYKLTNVKIATYKENVSGSSGTVQFTLSYTGMDVQLQK